MSTNSRVSKGDVLIVDDSEDIRIMFATRLRHSGYTVHSAASAAEGFQILGSTTIHLMILDLMMPGMDGYQALSFLRQKYTPEDLPILVLSARDRAEDVIQAIRLGANDYSMKTTKFGDFLERVEDLIQLQDEKKERRFGPFEIVETIGKGAMGRVYRAVDKRDDRVVALKVLPAELGVNKDFTNRFKREAELLSRFSHPHLVKFYSAGKKGSTLYLAMEFVKGRDLAHERIPKDQVLKVCRQVASGLAEVHKASILHRDVKPSNLILSDKGIIKIVDFGVAKDTAGPAATRSGTGVGSLAFASAEQIVGQADERSDIYSLGCTAYFLFTGEVPFSDVENAVDAYTMKLKKLLKVRKSAPNVSKEHAAIVEKMMEPRPEKRYQSCEELVKVIDAVLAKA